MLHSYCYVPWETYRTRGGCWLLNSRAQLRPLLLYNRARTKKSGIPSIFQWKNLSWKYKIYYCYNKNGQHADNRIHLDGIAELIYMYMILYTIYYEDRLRERQTVTLLFKYDDLRRIWGQMAMMMMILRRENDDIIISYIIIWLMRWDFAFSWESHHFHQHGRTINSISKESSRHPKAM